MQIYSNVIQIMIIFKTPYRSRTRTPRETQSSLDIARDHSPCSRTFSLLSKANAPRKVFKVSINAFIFIRLLHQPFYITAAGYWRYTVLLRLNRVIWKYRGEKKWDGKNGRKETEVDGERRDVAERIGCATSCARGALQWFIIVTRNIGIYIGEVPRAGSKWSRQGSIPSIYLNAPTFHRWRVLTATRGPAPCSFLIKLPRFPRTKRTLRETSHDWLYALHRLY